MRKLMTISLPSELHERVKSKKKETNISAVCQKAIEKHLDYLDGVDSGRLPSVRTLVTQIHNAVCSGPICLMKEAESKAEAVTKATKNGKSKNGKPGKRKQAVLPLRETAGEC